MIDRIRKAWRSLMSSFDYEPPKALADTEPADTEIMHPLHPPDVQAALDRIATAQAHELPAMVTRRTMDWATGVETITHQDGRELSVIDLAVMQRQAELRRLAGG